MSTDQEVTKWIEEVDAAARMIGPRFGRRDLRCHAECYLRGLISRIERKNGWQLAEELGQKTPTNLQHFVARSRWSADEVRDDRRQYVVEHLGSKDGVLIVDETGF
jgi:SRSO17 transposase